MTSNIYCFLSFFVLFKSQQGQCAKCFEDIKAELEGLAEALVLFLEQTVEIRKQVDETLGYYCLPIAYCP